MTTVGKEPTNECVTRWMKIGNGGEIKNEVGPGDSSYPPKYFLHKAIIRENLDF